VRDTSKHLRRGAWLAQPGSVFANNLNFFNNRRYAVTNVFVLQPAYAYGNCEEMIPLPDVADITGGWRNPGSHPSLRPDADWPFISDPPLARQGRRSADFWRCTYRRGRSSPAHSQLLQSSWWKPDALTGSYHMTNASLELERFSKRLSFIVADFSLQGLYQTARVKRRRLVLRPL